MAANLKDDPHAVTSNKTNMYTQQDTMEMIECDFQGQIIKYVAASTLLSLGSLTLVEANHQPLSGTLSLPYGQVHVVRS